MEPSYLDFHYLQMYVRIYLISQVIRLDSSKDSDKMYMFAMHYLLFTVYKSTHLRIYVQLKKEVNGGETNKFSAA